MKLLAHNYNIHLVLTGRDMKVKVVITEIFTASISDPVTYSRLETTFANTGMSFYFMLFYYILLQSFT